LNSPTELYAKVADKIRRETLTQQQAPKAGMLTGRTAMKSTRVASGLAGFKIPKKRVASDQVGESSTSATSSFITTTPGAATGNI
jgi:hypothetical protein